MSHKNGVKCTSCAKMLEKCDPVIVSWFEQIKAKFADCHISCGYRGEEAQRDAFKQGKSHVNWPNSKHNALKVGQPCSKAIDLFQLSEDGKALFEKYYFENISEYSDMTCDHAIFWGGNFRGLHDYVHFELVIPKGGK